MAADPVLLTESLHDGATLGAYQGNFQWKVKVSDKR